MSADGMENLPKLVQVKLTTHLPTDWDVRRNALLGEHDNEVVDAGVDDEEIMRYPGHGAVGVEIDDDDADGDDDIEDLRHITCHQCNRARLGRMSAGGEVRCIECGSTNIRVRGDDSPPPLEPIPPPSQVPSGPAAGGGGPAAGGGRGGRDVLIPIIVPNSYVANMVLPSNAQVVVPPNEIAERLNAAINAAFPPPLPQAAPVNMNPYHLVSGYLGPSDANSNALANILQQIVLGNFERNNAAAQPGAGRRPPPASPQLLAALQRVTVTEQNRSSLGSNGECYISQEPFEVGETCVVLPCSHGFKQDGIVRWLRIHNTCPVCRAVPAPTQAPDPLYDDMPPLIRSRVGRLDADTDDMLLMPPPRPSPPVPPAPGSEFDDLPPLVPEPGVELIETDAGTWSFMQ